MMEIKWSEKTEKKRNKVKNVIFVQFFLFFIYFHSAFSSISCTRVGEMKKLRWIEKENTSIENITIIESYERVTIVVRILFMAQVAHVRVYVVEREKHPCNNEGEKS